jgi:hypothetical protein
MSSQDRSGWGFAAVCGVVGAVAGGALGWGAVYLVLEYRLFGGLGLVDGLAAMFLVPCVGAVAGAIAGTRGGLCMIRRTGVGRGQKTD